MLSPSPFQVAGISYMTISSSEEVKRSAMYLEKTTPESLATKATSLPIFIAMTDKATEILVVVSSFKRISPRT